MHVLFVIKAGEETVLLNCPKYHRRMAGQAVREGFKAGDRYGYLCGSGRHSLKSFINPSEAVLARYFTKPHVSIPPLPA